MKLIKLRPRSDLIASEFSDLIETVCFDQESQRNLYLLSQREIVMSARMLLSDFGIGFTREFEVKMAEKEVCIKAGKTTRGDSE